MRYPWLLTLAAWMGVLSASLPVDAQVMTHSTSQTILGGNSISCNATGGLHADSSYWRTFNVCSPFNLQNQVTINTVQFGVENATAGNLVSQPVVVNIYEDTDGGLPAPISSLVLLHSQQVQVPNGTALQVFNVPLTTPLAVSCLATIVVEIFTPSGQGTANNSFFIGSNTGGQTSPSFISAPLCSITQPTNLASMGFTNMHIVINLLYSLGVACTPCSGVPVDCHVPLFGSYEAQFVDADVVSDLPGTLITDALPQVTATLAVSGVVGLIEDLDVFLDITHPYNGDLEIRLTDPSGAITVTLHDNAGVNLQDFFCIYDDDGRLNARPFNGNERIRPSGPGMLADFIGFDPNGLWTLTIVDGLISPTAGTLNRWELRFNRPLSIPDNVPAGVSGIFTLPATNVDELADLDVRVNVTHPARQQLAVELTSPAGTTVRLRGPGGAAGANLVERFDDPAGGSCDGFGSAVASGPGSLSDFDGQGVAGDWILRVVDSAAGQTGVLNDFVLMILPEPCAAPTNLACVSDCALGDVALTWALPQSYAGGIEVRRDGVVIATLAGTEVAFTDVAVPSGTYTYQVVGDCDPGRGAISCTLLHSVAGAQTDAIVAVEALDGVDSAAAVRAALVAQGIDPLVLTGFDAPCLQSASLERVWVLCGTFPANYVLTQADGGLLSVLNQSGVALFIEGVDVWGFDPQTALQDVDGVENTSFGNVLDGINDDSLVQLTGVDSGVGLNLSAFLETYNQASGGAEMTDRLVPCNVNADLGGSAAGVIWTGFDPVLMQPYNVGIYYDSVFAPVISQSWEFGGFGGNQNDLMVQYLSALGGGNADPDFRRGDANADGSVNLLDAIVLLNYLFVPGSNVPPCLDSADATDDGSVNLLDAVRVLNYLFVAGSPAPTAPGPTMCGPDVVADALPVCVYSACP